MSELLEEVNHRIRDLATKLDSGASSMWQFVCECGEEGCRERIGLSVAGYDALRSREAALLAPGHRLDRAPQPGR